MNKSIIAIHYQFGYRNHYDNIDIASSDLNISKSDILYVLTNKQKTTHGWRFIYEEDWVLSEGIK
jgi:hypothetical protein